ncbi:nucleotidyltransferase [[Mycoplasma] mobile]|uniref:tRNA(Met) cytidine acetate ligase n=1 Tax=Mycoplasma mobile (strain ATCC 43663 / 163K / NCTC 11711) TaxID=267748 RepID=TMCAL_MYCM1|nr:nucleotidyltransferase [[Mycoplasma] mobile]Q6KHT7.2 RecName: Full=tRNA(Met) cytidine acetate ligase [Mycoplasma mobile 163K]
MAIGIIAEYNPFHNGHIYMINYIKNKFPNEEIIVFMSGKYTQRGEIAVASFETRKKYVLEAGVSKVYELPFETSTQAAHIFAQGAIKMLYEYNVDKLIFGSETNDIDLFYKIANTLKNNEQEYNLKLKEFLKQGLGFPNASSLALKSLVGYEIVMPNDILGLEYVKAIVNNNYNIQAYCLKRTINFHSEFTLENFASASYLRTLIYKSEDISKYSPMIFETIPDRIENYYEEFKQKVISTSKEELAKISLISEGLENRFKKIVLEAQDYDSFVNKANSKRYTSSRIKRIMLYILLDIKK